MTTKILTSSSSSLWDPEDSEDSMWTPEDSTWAPPALMWAPSAPPSPIWTISGRSLRRLFGKSQTVMVYGKKHCLYLEVQEAAKSHMKRAYNCHLGDDTNAFRGTSRKSKDDMQRLDGTPIYQVTSGLSSQKKKNS